MNEAVKVNDNIDLVKSKLTFSNTTYKKKSLKLIIIPSLTLILSVLVIFVSIAIIDYQNAPRYQSMELVNSNLRDLSYNDVIEEDFPDVVTNENISSFAYKNTIVKIAVNLDNPKKFEILSFMINGYKYQSFEFQPGSTSDVIYVLITTQNESGIQELTIDEIKYVENTSIKNVRYVGNRTIKIGITYEYPPTLDILNKEITNNSFNIIFNTVDVDNLIKENTPYKGYLFEGNKLIYSQNIDKSLTQFTSGLLKMNTEYTFIVCTSIDLLDGIGLITHYLYQETFITLDGIKEVTINNSETSLDFEFEFEDLVTLLKIELFLDGVLYKESTNSSFTEIYSNTEYVAKVYYQYLYNETAFTDFIEIECFTKEYQIPSFDFSLDATHTEITFTEIEEDPFNLGSISSYKLYLNEVLVKSNELFTDLLSNNTYRVEITYTYNLLDNKNDSFIVVSKDITTLSYKLPTIDFTYQATQNSIKLEKSITDVDLVGIRSSFNLYLNENLLENELDLDSFTNLLSDTTYLVEMVYVYDLNDGLNEVELKITKKVKTTSYTIPTISGIGLAFANNIYLDLILNDPDSLSEIISIELYSGTELIHEFDSLDDYTTLTQSYPNLKIVVKYRYNLFDGKGVIEKEYSCLI